MARFSLDGYRKQWPGIGGVLAMALGGVTALTSGRMSKPQALSAVNFGALLVHHGPGGRARDYLPPAGG
jgi:hypothetical protein